MNSKAVGASVCNLPMKQACAFEQNTEFQPAPATTSWVPERPTTSRVCRHNGTARKRARQRFRLRTEKDIASVCSRIRCGHDDDERASHRVLGRSNGDEW